MSRTTERGGFSGGDRCPTCGKVRFLTRSRAKKVAKNLNRRRPGHLNAYRCGDFWHIGHLPSSVIKGDVPREELNAAPKRHMNDKVTPREGAR